MPNRITFVTEGNTTKVTFDYDTLQDIQVDSTIKPLGIDIKDATATASDILDGKTAYVNNNEKITGNIPSKSAETYTPGTTDQTIDAGKYLAGNQTVKGDANLIPENIADGVTIFDVVGTHQGGGTQPTLFAPVITVGVNNVSWANDTRNGGYNVTLTATVDGNTVTSPLTVTQAMDGKTLIVTASATNFESATSTSVLEYLEPSNSTYVAPSNDNFVLDTGTSYYFHNEDETFNTRWLFAFLNEAGNSYSSSKIITLAGGSGNQLKLVAKDGVGAIGTSGFAVNHDMNGGAERRITGTVVMENITKGTSRTWTFNNESQSSQYGADSFLSAGDVVKITINITEFNT